MADTFEIAFDDCARCGEAHDQIEVKAFTNAPDEASHFAICPTTGEPILVKYSSISAYEPAKLMSI